MSISTRAKRTIAATAIALTVAGVGVGVATAANAATGGSSASAPTLTAVDGVQPTNVQPGTATVIGQVAPDAVGLGTTAASH